MLYPPEIVRPFPLLAGPLGREVWFRRSLAALVAAPVAAILSAFAYFGLLSLTGNFHTVVEHELYRSAQPTAEQIIDYKRRFGIQTIVNLGGANASSPYYAAEVLQSRRLGIAHIDFPMSVRSEFSPERAAALIDILATARKPILIHCKSGADRSGLATALYLVSVSGRADSEAGEQISIRYGHVSLPFGGFYAIDRSFEALKPWLKLIRAARQSPSEKAPSFEPLPSLGFGG